MTKIALCLITKDSTGTIEPLLESVRPFVDGVFVYDTGSTDGTVELLERLNEWKVLQVEKETGRPVGPLPSAAEDDDYLYPALAPIVVQQGEWRDDFAWAREQSFAMPDDTYDWLLWADDDDTIEGAQWLRQLAATAPAELDGYIVFYDYAQDENGACVCQLWRERLIRRAAGYAWVQPVHEVLVPPDRPAVLANVPPEQIRYVHRRPPDRYAPGRNLEILLRQEAEHAAKGEPVPPRILAYLGTEHMAHGKVAEAVPYLQTYLEHPEAGWSDERMQVHHKLGACLRGLGNPQAAIEVEMLALRERDDWAETYVGLAQSFAVVGQFDRAIRWARRALETGMPQTPLILNPLEFSLIPWLTIAESAAHLGDSEQAQHAIQQAAGLAPANEYVRAKAEELRALIGQNEVVGAVLLLRETLVRHDENLKAYHLLENVPYVIAERPEIVKARADQREMVAHYLRPEEYERWYREEPKESTVPDDVVPEIGEHIPRAKRLLEGLQEQEQRLGRKPRVLDLGSNDMWIGCYLWLQGKYVVDGVELNKQSVTKGEKRMARFGAPGKLIHGNLADAKQLVNGRRYDAISLFEVLEHVPDVNATLDLMERLLAPGGVIYVSTPNGAYERGQINGWARVERKGHLRAIPVHDLASEFARRGDVENIELQHDGRLTFASYRPQRRKGRVSFYAGACWEPWSPASIKTTGLGGSETALVRVAARLAREGWQTTVYSGAEPGFYGGVSFRPAHAWDPTDDPDLLVVSRLPHVFDNPIGAKATALWCHDHSYPGALTEQRAAKIGHIITLSTWQRDRFARLYPYTEPKLTIIRNGITLTDPVDREDRYPDAEREFPLRQPRCIYSSSADRGLDVMLELWPRIRAQVPNAELHVFYGWDVFDRVAITNPGLFAYKAKVMGLVETAGGEEGGVFMRGRVGQPELAVEMMNARVWTYPTAFLETSCIGAMEARAAGLPIVTSGLGALKETVGPFGNLLSWAEDEDAPHNATSDEYRTEFVETTAQLLSSEDAWRITHRAARTDVDELDWSHRVPQWEALAAPVKAKRKPRPRAKATA